jgi:hypothetical protein
MGLFFGLILCFSSLLCAGTYRINKARTTTAQEYIYTQNALAEILDAEGYLLDLRSISITDEVAMPPMHTPVIVETNEFAVHTVIFEASKNGLFYTGYTYLILVNDQRLQKSEYKDRLVLNSTAQSETNYRWAGESSSTLALANSPDYRIFKAEMRLQDLGLLLKK